MSHPDNETRILSWEEYKKGNVYKHARALIKQEHNVENVLYQMFIAGWERSGNHDRV